MDGSEEKFAAWPLLISGIVLLAMGAICLLWPGLAYGVAGVMIGIGLIIAGVSCIVMRIGSDGILPTSSLTMWAVFSLIVGILFVANPVTSAMMLVWLAFAALLFFAVVNLVQGLNQRQSGETGPGTERIVGSAVAVVLAIIVMASPNMLVYSLALIALVAGGMLVYAALKAPKQLVR
mgnify:FL=1